HSRGGIIVTTPADRAVRTARSIESTTKAQAFELRAAEIVAWTELLATLGPDDWSRPTPCSLWDVKDIVGHLCGHAEEDLRPWLFPLRDRRAARRHPQMSYIDAHMQVQVEEHRGMTPAQVHERFVRVWPRANRRLRRVPGIVRRLRVPTGLTQPSKVSIAYLHDVIHARDLWMHRDDLCRAIGTEFAPGPHTPDVVEQVLRDLDEHWPGPTVILELTGAADGAWQLGVGAPVATVRADAVSYMRALAGRDSDPAAQVVTGDPSAAPLVTAARVLF
ncbi:MAG TPA: maleylpyruvate isomerase family mycothiol-dependent enzyme, partial [Sporichthyaceae bacterium]|nr:maleylpyruvate isomerase family mycothiol-dependent enzyme [Sporichthyaceae bacterium]